MSKPVQGKDVVLWLRKNDEFVVYACATEVRVRFSMEIKSVRTINDGVWRKVRGQTKQYQIDLNGLIVFDDDERPHAFDLYDYFDGMAPVEYRMIFTETDTGQLWLYEGFALPSEVGMGGGSEGFADADAILLGDGAPSKRNAIDLCSAAITDAEVIIVNDENALQINSVTGGPITRYDYQIDGGGRETALVDGTLPDTFVFGNSVTGGVGSTHTLTVIPVCDNGYDGESFDMEFTNQAPACVEVSIVGTPVLPDGEVGIPYFYSFDLVGTSPFGLTINNRPAWMSIVINGSAVEFSGTPDISILEAPVDITITNCSTGSVNFNDTIDVHPASGDQITVEWTFVELDTAGTFEMYLNGALIVSVNATNAGQFNALPTDQITAIVGSAGGITRTLAVTSSVSGVLYDNSGTTNQSYTWDVLAGHDYTVSGSVQF